MLNVNLKRNIILLPPIHDKKLKLRSLRNSVRGSSLAMAVIAQFLDIRTLLYPGFRDVTGVKFTFYRRIESGEGRMLIIKATKKNLPYMVKHLIDAGASLKVWGSTNVMVPMRGNPLHIAVVLSLPDIVKLLIDAGIDLEEENSRDYTALNLAAKRCEPRCLKLLVDSGANVEACRFGEQPSWRNNWTGLTPLLQASELGRYWHVKRLVNAGANVNVRDQSDMTPLHYAVHFCYKKTVKVLLDAGANKNAKSCGETPLHLAAENGYTDIVKILLDAGANKNAKCCGKTPMRVAAEKGHTDIVELLN